MATFQDNEVFSVDEKIISVYYIPSPSDVDQFKSSGLPVSCFLENRYFGSDLQKKVRFVAAMEASTKDSFESAMADYSNRLFQFNALEYLRRTGSFVDELIKSYSREKPTDLSIQNMYSWMGETTLLKKELNDAGWVVEYHPHDFMVRLLPSNLREEFSHIRNGIVGNAPRKSSEFNRDYFRTLQGLQPKN